MRAQPAPARRHHQWQASRTARQRQRPSHRRTVHRVFRQTLATKSLTTKPLTSKPLTRMFHDLFHAVFHGMFHAMFPMPSSERSAWHHPWRDAPATPTTPWPIRSAQALRDAPDRVWPRHSPTGRSSTWPLKSLYMPRRKPTSSGIPPSPRHAIGQAPQARTIPARKSRPSKDG